MSKNVAVRMTPETANVAEAILHEAARKAGVRKTDIRSCKVLRRSIDARRSSVMVNLQVRLLLQGEAEPEERRTVFRNVDGTQTVLVVGSGPAGLFAALRLLELGLRPVVLERGRDVHRRKRDIASLQRNRRVDANSNYCFGEGGAGTFSDGKLYTRSTKRGDVSKVLSWFRLHGADVDIEIDAHPHIGTDRLPAIVEAMRRTIESHGGVVRFSCRVTDLKVANGRLVGVETEEGEILEGPVILATGHSASDVYRMLDRLSLPLEPKGLAMGVRLEHPQALVDTIQYGKRGRGPYLPAAEYAFTTQVLDRGVYSFCMCPGGFVIPAMTDAGELVVNGMSPASRNGRFANSGLVVEIRPEDLGPRYAGALGMLEFRQALEHRLFKAGGSDLRAPSQRMADFVDHRVSSSLPESSYFPGLANADLHAVFPPFLSRRLAEACSVFGRKARGFLTNEACLIGGETRTSSPVRIPRDATTLMHVRLDGLFPCGEGAGYAGGIVSAALDGINCADAVARYLGC